MARRRRKRSHSKRRRKHSKRRRRHAKKRRRHGGHIPLAILKRRHAKLGRVIASRS